LAGAARIHAKQLDPQLSPSRSRGHGRGSQDCCQRNSAGAISGHWLPASHHCQLVGSCRVDQTGQADLGQSADISLSASPVGPYGSAVHRHLGGKIVFNPCFACRRQAAKPDKRAAHLDSDVSTVRNHQRLRRSQCWETRLRSKSGARSFREGRLRPLGERRLLSVRHAKYVVSSQLPIRLLLDVGK
jgi:hypothetical protein